MNELIYILLFIIGCLVIKLYRVNQEKKINYHNYKSCLMALGEYDPKLKEYMEGKYEK